MSYAFDTLHAPELGGEHILDADVFAALEELAGDDDPDLVAELIELYLDDSRTRMTQIESAIKVGDADTIGAAAHALKSSSANIGACSLSQVCSDVEKMARNFEPFDPTMLEELVTRTLAMYTEVCQTLGATGIESASDSAASRSLDNPH